MHLSWQRYITYFFIAAYAALSLHVMMVFMVGSEFGGLNIRSAHRMIEGTADRPYVYRQLVPMTARALTALTPEFLAQPLTESLIDLRDSRLGAAIITARYPSPPGPLADDRILETATVLAVVYASLLGFIAMLYRLTRTLMPQSRAYALAAPMIGLLALPPLAIKFAYIYDFAELFFSCACLYLLYKQRWRDYLIVLALATLNKETSLFCIFFYALWYWKRLPREEYLRMGALQLAVYFAVKLALNWYYADNSGTAAALGFYMQLRHYASSYNMYSFLGILAAIFVLAYRWREKPAFARAALCMLIPNVFAFLVYGYPDEYRVFYFSLPPLMLLAAHTLVRATQLDEHPLFRNN